MSASDPDLILHTPAELDALLERDGPVLLFKHSTACPVSARAHERFRAWLGSTPHRPWTALVHVIEDRPVSDRITAALRVRHESPQALLVRGGKVLWHASHGDITAGALESACAKRD